RCDNAWLPCYVSLKVSLSMDSESDVREQMKRIFAEQVRQVMQNENLSENAQAAGTASTQLFGVTLTRASDQAIYDKQVWAQIAVDAQQNATLTLTDQADGPIFDGFEFYNQRRDEAFRITIRSLWNADLDMILTAAWQ